MVTFSTTLKKFEQQGEKTGWTYIEISGEIATQLKPGNKQSFRVKGKLDNFTINKIALLPMGNGNFIMAVNAAMRKGIGKRKGAQLSVTLETDTSVLEMNEDLITCLLDEPAALNHFQSLAKGHQNYFSKFIDSAKTEQTKAKRISMAVSALSKGIGFTGMMRQNKQEKSV